MGGSRVGLLDENGDGGDTELPARAALSRDDVNAAVRARPPPLRPALGPQKSSPRDTLGEIQTVLGEDEVVGKLQLRRFGDGVDGGYAVLRDEAPVGRGRGSGGQPRRAVGLALDLHAPMMAVQMLDNGDVALAQVFQGDSVVPRSLAAGATCVAPAREDVPALQHDRVKAQRLNDP